MSCTAPFEAKLRSFLTPKVKLEHLDALVDAWLKLDVNQTEELPIDQLSSLVIAADFNQIPAHEYRHMLKDRSYSKITLEAYVFMYIENDKKETPNFRQNVRRLASVKHFKKSKQNSQKDTSNKERASHIFSKEEVLGFSNWINAKLANHPKVSHLLPIDGSSPTDLFEKLENGIILCLMMQLVDKNLIDDRAINYSFNHVVKKHENINLAIMTAQSVGISVINIHSEFILEGRPNICLGLIWQVIRAGLFVHINLNDNPNIARLLYDGESLEDLKKLSTEQLLLRWVNYHLERNENYDGEPISNFSGDIKDSKAYQYLMEQIQPQGTGIVARPDSIPDLHNRAERTLEIADKLDCRAFVTAGDIVSGQPKLNLAFVANLFNNHPALEDVEISDEIIETREEKMYRNFMNSLGIKPQINYLYGDLIDGLAILKVEDKIKPGLVDWKRVNLPPFKPVVSKMKKLENCNKAIGYAPELNIKLAGLTSGQDIYDARRTLVLGFVWQLLRAYTISLLTELSDDKKAVEDKDIIAWFNLKTGMDITSFKDPRIRDGVAVQKCLQAVIPEIEMEELSASKELEKMTDNARYVINLARRSGATVYSLPEDLAEGNPKMILCLVVTLMVLEKQNQE